jgi:hypothetical protein
MPPQIVAVLRNCAETLQGGPACLNQLLAWVRQDEGMEHKAQTLRLTHPLATPIERALDTLRILLCLACSGALIFAESPLPF